MDEHSPSVEGGLFFAPFPCVGLSLCICPYSGDSAHFAPLSVCNKGFGSVGRWGFVSKGSVKPFAEGVGFDRFGWGTEWILRDSATLVVSIALLGIHSILENVIAWDAWNSRARKTAKFWNMLSHERPELHKGGRFCSWNARAALSKPVDQWGTSAQILKVWSVMHVILSVVCDCALMHSVWAFSGALRLCRFSARSLYLRGKQTCPCLLDSSTSWRFLHYLCKKVGGFNTAIPHHCMPATCQDTDSLMGATDSPAELWSMKYMVSCSMHMREAISPIRHHEQILLINGGSLV